MDNASDTEFLESIYKVKNALYTIHQGGILHTDLTSFNVMVRRSTKEPIVIDLLGSIEIGSQQFRIQDDIKVFVEYFLVPSLQRRKIFNKEIVLSFFKSYTYQELDQFISELIESRC